MKNIFNSFLKLIGSIPLPVRLALVAIIIVAGYGLCGLHPGIFIAPAPLLVPAPGNRTRGAGNSLWFMQIEMKSDNSQFQALTAGTDCLGSTSHGWHQVGTMDKSPLDRNADASYKVTTTILEDDTIRMNIFNAVAPYNLVVQPPDYTAEDGTIIQTSGGNVYDPTLPVFLIAKREATLSGANRFFIAVAQFGRASKRPNDPKNWNTKDLTINTVNALSFVATLPSDSMFTGATAPTLSGTSVMGVIISQ